MKEQSPWLKGLLVRKEGIKMHYIFRNLQNKILLKYKFWKANSSIGKIISANNAQYVVVGNNTRIKDYCRIDCYDSFGGDIILH